MLNGNILKALNEQLKHEEKNSRTYYQMAGWCDDAGFLGCAKWFYASAKDETAHKEMIATYIADRDMKFELSALDKPKCEFTGIQELFKITQQTEESTTKSLQELYRLAMTEGDYLTAEFILPMLKEQVEEERKVQDVLDYLKLTGIEAPGIAIFDSFVKKLAR